jgi:hypothetical protein
MMKMKSPKGPEMIVTMAVKIIKIIKESFE